ncbi:MAG TPA: hypothetical protein VEW08_05735 [Steroidobacteraceae bacterium]|nr:hypothetical protein [Steroidobacteraceae bacterium]
MTLILVPALLALGGCATADVAMKLAPDLAATTALPVTGRDPGTQLAFGRWHVAMPAPYRMDGWQISGTPRFVPANSELSVKAERASLEFEVVADAGSRPASAGCLAQGRFASLTTFHARSEDETSVTIPGFPRLDCEFSGARTGTLALRADFATQRDWGDARFGADHWLVRSVNTHAKQRSNFPLTRFGYEIVLGERVVAAVETYGAGRVWVLPDLSREQQEQLSTVAAALLYYGRLLDLQE